MASEPALLSEVGMRMSRAVNLTIVRGMVASSRGMVASRHREMATERDPVTSLKQSWPKPTQPRPIVVIGAGSIVRDAHLPIYSRLGFPLAGIFDVNPAAAQERARQFQLARVFDTIDEALTPEAAIFDL